MGQEKPARRKFGNAIDYLERRGDASFSEFEPGEVDFLIFSEIAYCPVENIPRAELGGKLLDYFDCIWPRPLTRKDGFVKKPRYDMFLAMRERARYSELRIDDCLTVMDKGDDMQFSVTILSFLDVAVVAFRGTDSTLVGWKEDFNMAFDCPVASQSKALEYLDSFLESEKSEGKRIHVCGHSKGGNIALYAAALCRKPERIERIWMFDAPGFCDNEVEKKIRASVGGKVFSCVPESSVIGMLLGYWRDCKVVKSESFSVLQHNPFYWHVDGDAFADAPRVTHSSRIANGTLHHFLDAYPVDKRRILIETIFRIFAASGAEQTKDLVKGLFDHRIEVRKIVQGLTNEERTVLTRTLPVLIDCGGRSLKELFGNQERF